MKFSLRLIVGNFITSKNVKVKVKNHLFILLDMILVVKHRNLANVKIQPTLLKIPMTRPTHMT